MPNKEKFTFGSRRFDKKIVLLVMNLIIASFVGLTFLLSQPVIISNELQKPAFEKSLRTASTNKANSIKVESTHELMARLKELNLWEISQLTEIPQVVINGFPMNFHELNDMTLRKKLFLHTLLPSALVALQEVQQERIGLILILRKTGRYPEKLDFSINQADWEKSLTKDEIDFIRNLAEKYRTQLAFELLDRIDVVPISLILGQGAIESSWGRSRFARSGNNIFGMWTWGGEGIIPADREVGKQHKVKIYNSILESVRSYILTLNRLSAYNRLRELRRLTTDSLKLAGGLIYYSERRDSYVQDLRHVINSNNLQNYDHFILTIRQTQPRLKPSKRSDIEPAYISRSHNGRI